MGMLSPRLWPLFLLLINQTLCYEPQVIDGKWNEKYNRKSGANSTLTIFRFEVNQEYLVARVVVHSNESSSNNPVLVVIRERKAVLSMQVPLIISNYEYNTVGRTICPLSDVQKGEILTIEISSFQPVDYTFEASIVENFVLDNKNTRQVKSSASEPIYLEYHIPEDITSVVVHVDSNTTACMTVSVQRIGCPVFDLANNVISTGSYQTMAKSASIAVERSLMKSFYVIFVVNSNDNLCSEIQQILPIKPTRMPLRIKHFNVTIESVSAEGDYFLPLFLTFLVFGFVILVVLTYIYFDNISETRYFQNYTALDEEPFDSERRRRIQEDEMLDDPELRDYDILLDCVDKHVIRAKSKLTVADMSLKLWKSRDKKYRIYWVSLATVGLFYGLPVVQLVLTWQNTVRLSGDMDLCYYNFRCAKPWLGFFAFNSIVSNSGYVILGASLIFMNWYRTLKYQDLVAAIPRMEYYVGIPNHGGLMNAIGVSVMMEGILSASYHICPSASNYQFDTSFMYVIGMLGMLKIYQLRHPDVNASAHVALAVVAVFILIAMVGVFFHNVAFWTIFAIVYMFTIFNVSVHFYFKGVWKLNLREQWNSMKYSFASSRRCSCIIPAHLGRFLILLLANFINFAFLVFGVINRPKDFASFLLLPFMANLFLYVIYYFCMKIGYREKIHPRSWVLLFLSAGCWAVGAIFFYDGVSDWSKTPAMSREMNKQCSILKFYDHHDIWHFLSSLAIFMSFTLINRLDDDLMLVPRNQIIVF